MGWNRLGRFCYGSATVMQLGKVDMKGIGLAAAALAVLALSACSRNNPEKLGNDIGTTTNAEEQQQQDLNALADQAANVANEAQQLENQAQQVKNETEKTLGPQTPADENIQGM